MTNESVYTKYTVKDYHTALLEIEFALAGLRELVQYGRASIDTFSPFMVRKIDDRIDRIQAALDSVEVHRLGHE